MSNSLQPHGLQHTRLPCPSLTPRAYSNSCPSSLWYHPTISSSVVPFSPLPSIFPSIRVFSNESVLCTRWPKYWSFSFSVSPSNEYLGPISFRIDWLDLLAVQETCKSLQYHSSKAPNIYIYVCIYTYIYIYIYICLYIFIDRYKLYTYLKPEQKKIFLFFTLLFALCIVFHL